jgi:hypothetical protein
LAIAPHVAWLYADGFRAFGYAMQTHASTAFEAFLSDFSYLAGTAAYLAAPILVAVAAARPRPPAILDAIWPPPGERRLIWWAFVLPLVLPVVGAIVIRAEIVPLWSIGAMTLFPVVLLSSPLVTISRPAARRILALAIVVPIIAAALSPAIAVVIHWRGVSSYASQYSLLARAVDKTWSETTDQPLRLVGGCCSLVEGTLFYFSERPSPIVITDPSLTRGTDDTRVEREGIAMFCPAKEVGCVTAMDARAARGPAGKRVEVELARSYLGSSEEPARYVIVTVPPRAASAPQ